jgi:replication fork clamp-binding protein CrfC
MLEIINISLTFAIIMLRKNVKRGNKRDRQSLKGIKAGMIKIGICSKILMLMIRYLKKKKLKDITKINKRFNINKNRNLINSKKDLREDPVEKNIKQNYREIDIPKFRRQIRRKRQKPKKVQSLTRRLKVKYIKILQLKKIKL